MGIFQELLQTIQDEKEGLHLRIKVPKHETQKSTLKSCFSRWWSRCSHVPFRAKPAFIKDTDLNLIQSIAKYEEGEKPFLKQRRVFNVIPLEEGEIENVDDVKLFRKKHNNTPSI